MTIWEISEKADFIAGRHHRLQEEWRHYCNTLVQGITLSKARLHHAIGCAPEQQLCFVLFEHFTLSVTLVGGFNGHTIEYAIAGKDGGEPRVIAQAQLSSDGLIDGVINNRDREKVLNHYLDAIADVYNNLYAAMETDSPVTLTAIARNAHAPALA
ncbi:formate hydrogenlyase regulator HycA [Kosakonia sp. ML.JS2a]|uniref:formate hydrogenlyase regulator HycA n=1 Tax=Kosakonia sp. ML.JS2a TaxID=2980557 RepID=UPI0021DAA3BD|nr:formate hydrogenlyase regulator HycA [Kosakonia sp. ML.JS2a]UXY11930.1 formate hydrogenlyase regulator HycA [Kosakonia sp. ML.JS2a]